MNARNNNKDAWSSVYPQSSLIIVNAMGMFGTYARACVDSQMLLRCIRESNTEIFFGPFLELYVN